MLLAERLSTEEIMYLQSFVNKKQANIKVTEHFFERWNERVRSPKFENKENLTSYLENKALRKRICKINSNHHIIDNDIIIVTKKSQNKNEFILVTTYGSTTNNPILYNMCVYGDAEKNFKKYGKINLDYVS